MQKKHNALTYHHYTPQKARSSFFERAHSPGLSPHAIIKNK